MMNSNNPTDLLRQIRDGIAMQNKQIAPSQQQSRGYENPFTTYTVDLTAAHVDLRITVGRPIRYIQLWCDGSMDGISIKLAEQSAPSISQSQMTLIPVNSNPEYIYLSNDLRQGRSRLVIYWVRSDPLNLNYGGQDISLAELASRLGSITAFDRRGDVDYYDDFENNGSRWVPTLVGVGAAKAISTDYSHKGEASLKLTTGNAIGNLTNVYLSQTYPSYQKIGLEAASKRVGGPTFGIGYGFSNGVYTYLARLRIVPAAPPIYNRFYIYTAAAYLQIGTGYLSGEFDSLKLVMNMSPLDTTGVPLYERVIINDRIFDVSQYPLDVLGPGVFTRYFIATAEAMATANANADAYFDDFIITKNEP
jgi:hypothetical protein